MTQPTEETRGRGTAAVAAVTAMLAAGVTIGVLMRDEAPGRKHFEATRPDAGITADATCYATHVYAPPEFLAAYGQLPDGGTNGDHLVLDICVNPGTPGGLHATLDQMGLTLIHVGPAHSPRPGRASELEGWLKDDPEAPYECACAPKNSSTCEWCRPVMGQAECVWGPAPNHVLTPGTFRGKCRPSPCVESQRGGLGSAWPEECKR